MTPPPTPTSADDVDHVVDAAGGAAQVLGDRAELGVVADHGRGQSQHLAQPLAERHVGPAQVRRLVHEPVGAAHHAGHRHPDRDRAHAEVARPARAVDSMILVMHLVAAGGSGPAGSSCCGRGSGRRARPARSPRARPAGRPRARPPRAAGAGPAATGGPRRVRRPRHLLLDDAVLGEPVDEGLDGAAVEPQSRRPASPGCSARRRAAGGAGSCGCAGAPRRVVRRGGAGHGA